MKKFRADAVSGRIIKPGGRLLTRINVDIDHFGQVQVDGGRRVGTTMVPLPVFEVAKVLSHVVANLMEAMGGNLGFEVKREAIKPHAFMERDNWVPGEDRDCQLCGEFETAECHKGDANGD